MREARPTLSLYTLSYCPFCHKVRHAADRLGIELDLIDLNEVPGARAELRAALGRSTVPVLAIPTESGARLLPESDDIVAFLEQHADRYRIAA